MASVKFYLRNSGGEESSVYMFFNYDGRRLRLSTGEKISPLLWNSRQQRAKQSRQFPQHPEFNHRLQQLEDEVQRIYRTALLNKKKPTDALIKAEFSAFLKGESTDSSLSTFFSFIEDFIATANRKYTTKLIYGDCLKHLQNYTKRKRTTVSFESIDLDFYNSFSDYLTKEQKMSNNSAGKHIKTLKVFMNEALERGLTANRTFQSRRFKVLKEEVDHIYLTQQELKTLFDFDFSANKKLEGVRDLFIVGAYTGLRFSDFTRIKEEHLREGLLNIRTEKTDEVVVIPLHPYVKQLLTKYKNALPGAVSNQRMNYQLKEIAKLAGIEERVPITRTVAGVRETKVLHKWELISTHTARRSFATNAFLAGVPSISIMKITGHRSESAFLGYIKMSQEDNARKLLHHPFFTTAL